jgi:TrmH family RNA methyltransferase
MERISSRQNAIVKRFRALAQPSGRRGTDEVLLDGPHLVEEALACRVPIDVAAFSDGSLAGAAPPGGLADAIARAGGRVVVMPDAVLTAMSPVRHPAGVVAIARPRADGVDAVFSSGERGVMLIAILAGIQDPGNVGAIIRSAAALGASGVVTLDETADPYGWKALRGAMGATFRLPVARASEAEVLEAVRDHGVRLVAAVPRDGIPAPDYDWRGPTAVAFGGEGAGVSQALLDRADARITIPMPPPVESLNVAVAAALVIYEARRPRAAGHTA